MTLPDFPLPASSTQTNTHNQSCFYWLNSCTAGVIFISENCTCALPAAPPQPRNGSARTSCTWRACGQRHSQTRKPKILKIKIRKYTQTFKTIICSVEKEYCWVFQLPDLISGPLDGVLYNRRERLESAEWDLLFWGVPLGGRRKAILGWWRDCTCPAQKTNNMSLFHRLTWLL